MFKKFLLNTLTVILVICTLCVIMAGYIFIDNNDVKITRYSVYSNRLAPVFDGYNIALITDFHNSDNVQKVIKKTAETAPEVIVIVGDSINMEDTVFDSIGLLVEGLLQIAPVYLVSGNHEIWSKNQAEFLNFIADKGVIVLNDKVAEIKYKNSAINLAGYKDIIYADEQMRFNILDSEFEKLYGKVENKKLFNILLFHRGNYFDNAAKQPFDLVLSGHLHGGQINLPFIKDRILMKRVNSSKYSKGYYRLGNSQMIISGGLEKNYINPRILNTPEVVSVTLKYLK